MSKYYRRIEIDTDGNNAEPVNFVGVHPLRWDEDQKIPDAGFVEAEVYEKEFVEWIGRETHFSLQKFRVVLADRKTFETLDELYEYWKTEVKGKETKIKI